MEDDGGGRWRRKARRAGSGEYARKRETETRQKAAPCKVRAGRRHGRRGRRTGTGAAAGAPLARATK